MNLNVSQWQEEDIEDIVAWMSHPHATKLFWPYLTTLRDSLTAQLINEDNEQLRGAIKNLNRILSLRGMMLEEKQSRRKEKDEMAIDSATTLS